MRTANYHNHRPAIITFKETKLFSVAQETVTIINQLEYPQNNLSSSQQSTTTQETITIIDPARIVSQIN